MAREHLTLEPRSEHYAQSARSALHHLERGLFEPAGRRVPPNGAVRLLEAGGERAEAELVGASVLELLRDGMAPEDIAVLVRGGPASELFAQVFDTYGIPVAHERRTPFGETRLGAGLLAFARAARPGGTAQDVVTWLRTPGKLAAAPPTARDGGDESPAATVLPAASQEPQSARFVATDPPTADPSEADDPFAGDDYELPPFDESLAPESAAAPAEAFGTPEGEPPAGAVPPDDLPWSGEFVRPAKLVPPDEAAAPVIAARRLPGVPSSPDLADRLEVAVRRAEARTAREARFHWERLGGRELSELDALADAETIEAQLQLLVAEADAIWTAPHVRQADVLSTDAEHDARAARELRHAARELTRLAAIDPALVEDVVAALGAIEVRDSGALEGAPGVLLADPLNIRARRFRAVFVCWLAGG